MFIKLNIPGYDCTSISAKVELIFLNRDEIRLKIASEYNQK